MPSKEILRIRNFIHTTVILYFHLELEFTLPLSFCLGLCLSLSFRLKHKKLTQKMG